MDAPAEPPGAGPIADASAAFFGLWPKFAEPAERPPVVPLRPRLAVIAQEQPRLRMA
jgi:hypothetical protein